MTLRVTSPPSVSVAAAGEVTVALPGDLSAAQPHRRCEQDRLRDTLRTAPSDRAPPHDQSVDHLPARAVMTDAQIEEILLWEIKVAGGRLSMMGASDAQIVRAWLAVLKRLDDAREFPIMDHAPLDMH